MLGPTYPAPQSTLRRSSRSNSVSSSSVITVKRSSSPNGHPHEPIVHIRSNSPAESALLAAHVFKAGAIPTKSRRTSVTQDRPEGENTIIEGVGNLNRWSHSTNSSISSIGKTGRVKAGGGTAQTMQAEHLRTQRRPSASPAASPHLRPESPRSSPHRNREGSDGRAEKYRHRVPSANSMRSPTQPKLSIPSSKPSPALDQKTFRPLTPGSTGLLTPNSLQNANIDYFGGPLQKDMASIKAEEPSPISPITGHSKFSTKRPVQEQGKMAEMAGITQPVMEAEGADLARRRSRTRERREKDKKTMLSKALEKANTAVLLDNAQNFEGALDAYEDACRLLQLVMDRTSGAEDKRKLDAIRETYHNRIEELHQMQQPEATETEKQLPPRPTSNDSEDFGTQMENALDSHLASRQQAPVELPSGPLSPVSFLDQSTGADMSAKMHSSNPPTSSLPTVTRDSFLTNAILEVEGDRSGGFLGPLWERSKSPLGIPLFEDQSPPSREGENGSYVPPPLSPWRPVSPVPPPKDYEISNPRDKTPVEEKPQPKEDTNEPGSWLDTIDESGSSRASSVHSGSPGPGRRRKNLGRGRANTDSGFDVAFDAAVEAAYEQGYEPDQSYNNTSMRNASGATVRPPTALSAAHAEGDEEERMLDDITKDYMGSGFDFNLKSKSALPRESDSSGYSRSTWQSSQTSDRHTAATSLSTLPENVSHARSSTRGTPQTIPLSATDEALASTNLPLGPLGRTSSENENQILTRRSKRISGSALRALRIDTSPRPKSRQPAGAESLARQLSLDDSVGQQGETRSITGQSARSEKRNSNVPSLRRVETEVSTPNPNSALSDSTNSVSMNGAAPTNNVDTFGDLHSPRPRFLRKNKSSASLRDQGIARTPTESDPPLPTPQTASFSTYGRRNESFSTHRSTTTASISENVGGPHLFDTSLGIAISPPTSPNEAPSDNFNPPPIEPCPDSYLLRPFWLLRCISTTVTHPRGGYLTTHLFMPHEAWMNRSVKLRNVEDKIASCDLLTAALSRLGKVDTYDADAVLEELQGFEEVMERVQGTLVKRLGGEVGVHGVGQLFKDAATTTAGSSGAGPAAGDAPPEISRDGPKTNSSGKSSWSSWRKLRGKNSMSGSSVGIGMTVKEGGPQVAGMSSVPMTTFQGVEKRTNHVAGKSQLLGQGHGHGHGHAQEGRRFQGPHREYMASVARLCDAAQSLDQIARQVEDPGLKHSSPTHVGLELSTRHAAEFFGFYVCRFLLADVGMLVEKYVKRSSEWVLN